MVQALQPPQRKKTAIFDSVRAFRLKSLFRFGLRCQIRPIVLAGSSFLRVLIAGKRLFLTLLASERELGRRHFWRLSFLARPRKQGEAATVVWKVDLVLAVERSGSRRRCSLPACSCDLPLPGWRRRVHESTSSDAYRTADDNGRYAPSDLYVDPACHVRNCVMLTERGAEGYSPSVDLRRRMWW